MKLPFPTIRNLKNMSAIATIEELIDWANTTAQEGIIRLCPIRVQENGKSKWTVWGDDDYPADKPL